MAKRDTIINVTDIRSGHTARIRVPFSVLQNALKEEYGLGGRPVASVDSARKYICMHAKDALAKKGRLQKWLSWEDIADSVRSSDQVPARGTSSDAAVSTAYRAKQSESKPGDGSLKSEHEPMPGHGQLSLFANQLSFD